LVCRSTNAQASVAGPGARGIAIRSGIAVIALSFDCLIT
jgi:hypothetical protein